MSRAVLLAFAVAAGGCAGGGGGSAGYSYGAYYGGTWGSPTHYHGGPIYVGPPDRPSTKPPDSGGSRPSAPTASPLPASRPAARGGGGRR